MSITLAPLPVRHADNAYDLLTEVIDAIRAEPKRLEMSSWISSLRADTEFIDDLPRRYPACGTVACIAGWISLLSAPTASLQDASLSAWDAQDRALLVVAGPMARCPYDYDGYYSTVLGGWEDQTSPEVMEREAGAIRAYKRYADRVRRWNGLFLHTYSQHQAGTQAYADEFADKIKSLQESDADFLRARRIDGDLLDALDAVDAAGRESEREQGTIQERSQESDDDDDFDNDSTDDYLDEDDE